MGLWWFMASLLFKGLNIPRFIQIQGPGRGPQMEEPTEVDTSIPKASRFLHLGLGSKFENPTVFS
jgi:hypothetical protein